MEPTQASLQTVFSADTSTNETLSPLDLQIQQVTKLLQNNPKPASLYAILGVLYFQDKKYSKAMEAFDSAIREAPDDPKIVLAYSRRAEYNLLFNRSQALEDLKKAKSFFGSISLSEEERISNNLRKLEAKKQAGESSEMSSSIPKLHAGRSSTSSGPIPMREGLVGENTTDFFLQYISFIEGNLDVLLAGTANEEAKNYWNAMAIIQKALEREKEHGIDRQVEGMYRQAKELLDSIIATDSIHGKHVPSNLYFTLATVHFKLYERSHTETDDYNLKMAFEHANRAILKNPSEPMYFRLRSIIYSEKGDEVNSTNDLMMASELGVDTEITKVKSAYNKINHAILFYDQIKLEVTTFRDVLQELVDLKKIKLSGRKINALTPEQIVSAFQQANLLLTGDLPHILDPIPNGMYDCLRKVGVEIMPKRGENLSSLDELIAKRGMLLSILGKKDPEKLTLALEDLNSVLAKISIDNPLYIKALIGRSKVYESMGRLDESLADLRQIKEIDPLIDNKIDQIIADLVERGQAT